ncbi:MAG: hypothetical protein Q7J27_02285 [Syntrophales bacterium]|nr:hypothetical protein [Syntrophales bacterium]
MYYIAKLRFRFIMKMTLQHKMFFWVIFILLLAKCANVSFCAEQDSVSLDKQLNELINLANTGKTNEFSEKVKAYTEKMKAHSATNWENVCSEQEAITVFDRKVIQLEEIWEAGKTNEYFEKAKVIARDIREHPAKNNLNGVAAKLLNKLMAKKVSIIDIHNNDLYAMDYLACRLLSNDKVSIKERRINALLLCRFLGKIRKEIIPNFKRRPVMRNVVPPIDVPRATAGMSPEVITNLVLRAQYEDAIRENRENNLMNSRQAELRSIEREMSKPIINYIIETFRGDVAEMGGKQAVIMDNMIKTFRGDDASIGLLAECIQATNLTDKEKEEVLKKVGVKRPKQGKATGIDQ